MSYEGIYKESALSISKKKSHSHFSFLGDSGCLQVVLYDMALSTHFTDVGTLF